MSSDTSHLAPFSSEREAFGLEENARAISDNPTLSSVKVGFGFARIDAL